MKHSPQTGLVDNLEDIYVKDRPVRNIIKYTQIPSNIKHNIDNSVKRLGT